MAFWVVDGGRSQGATGRGPYFNRVKRRVSHSDGGDSFEYKRTRVTLEEFRPHGYTPDLSHGEFGYAHENRFAIPPHAFPSSYRPGAADGFSHPVDDDDYYHHDHDFESTPPPAASFLPRTAIPMNNHAFYVIRERSPTPELPPIPPLGFGPGGCHPGMGPVLAPPGPSRVLPGACAMERTESGLSISSDNAQQSLANLGPEDEDGLDFMSDVEATRLVLDHVAGLSRRRRPDSQHGRILKVLINPKSRGDTPDWPLDNDALGSIFSAANELFFANTLNGRVAWDWSHPASAQYQAHIVGTTAVRRSRLGGYETLIVLSSPILKDTKYNRRLLISTFLHEMIHSYLFVKCGLKAGHCGGHTDGFRQIAETIDNWVGRGYLRLGEMEADLEQFREQDERWKDKARENNNHNNNIININNQKGPNPDNEWRKRGGSPRRRWDGRAERDGHEYYPTEPRPPPPQRHQQILQHPGYEDWQWHDRDGFHSHGARGVGSPYV